jgi:hypothetical protein
MLQIELKNILINNFFKIIFLKTFFCSKTKIQSAQKIKKNLFSLKKNFSSW